MPKGGKREGSGRKKTGRTKQPYIPVKYIGRVKAFIEWQKTFDGKITDIMHKRIIEDATEELLKLKK